jgi:hypothetical protein
MRPRLPFMSEVVPPTSALVEMVADKAFCLQEQL